MARLRSGTPRPSEESDSVARGLRRGDAEATALVRRRVGRIVAFRGYGIPRETQADLVQEVMVQLWQSVNRPEFDPGAGFWGFIETVAARRCIDWWRTLRSEVELDSGWEDPGRGPLANVLARERSQQVLEVLSQMSKPCRELILMRFSLGKSYAEISELTSKSEGALRVQLHRCVARFGELLKARSAENPQEG